DSDDLELQVLSGGSEVGDSVRVLAWFNEAGRNTLERIEFASGAVWTPEDIQRFLNEGRPLPLADGQRRPLAAGADAGLAWADAAAAFASAADGEVATMAGRPAGGWRAGLPWGEESPLGGRHEGGR
ncbi:MAG: calcium-binding protein, partial [Rubrivivax sp.]